MTRYSENRRHKTDHRGRISVIRLPSSAFRPGLTLIEMIAAIGISAIVMLSAGLLISSGYRGWKQSYDNANCEARLGAMSAMIKLGAIGRKANKMDYRVYKVEDDTFTKVVPLVDPEEVLAGQAVEFRYWDTELEPDLMDPDVNATAYALFYLDPDTDQLKVDFGPYPPGAIDAGGQRITGANVHTTTLTGNVFSAEFSHTAKNMAGDGRGCVRMKLIIIDPSNGSPKTTIAATLMRNTWPN